MTGSDYRGIGEAFVGIIYAAIALLCIFVPLGLWKLIEIIVWCCRHFQIVRIG